MFKKLLNVGKGHSNAEEVQQQQQQQKNLFQLNEIRSYGFSHHCCLSYSAPLSLLAVGSKTGLLRVLGRPTVEFNYQLDPPACIRQIEFISCRDSSSNNQHQSNKSNKASDEQQQEPAIEAAAKLVVLTEIGQLHLFELTTVKSPECTRLDLVGKLDYFIPKLDDEDRSKRVTTFEISANGKLIFVGTEGGNLYKIPLDKFDGIIQRQSDGQAAAVETTTAAPDEQAKSASGTIIEEQNKLAQTNGIDDLVDHADAIAADAATIAEPFDIVKFDADISNQVDDEIKPKKQGAIESVKRHPASDNKLLLSYHRGLSIIYNVENKQVEKFFYHNQVLESSCFASANSGDVFYTSHNDGSYIRWDTQQGSQARAEDDAIGQLFGPYPCKPTPKIQACTGLANDQLEELIIFNGGMPRATYDDKNPVTIVRSDPSGSGKDSIKVVLDFTSKVLDFAVITRPRGQLGIGAKSTTSGGGGGGKKNKNKQQQQQQQQRNQPIAVALAILADEEFVVIDLLNSESYLEFPLPYLNCVQPSAITCNQHYSNIGNELYEQLSSFSKQQLRGKSSLNEWPITGGKVVEAPEMKSRDILLTGHEDGSVNIWDVSDLAMRHLLHLPTANFFATEDDDLVPLEGAVADKAAADSGEEGNQEENGTNWPPLKRVGRFDPYSDDTRLAIRKINMSPIDGTLLLAGTGGQVLVFELGNEPQECEALVADEVSIVSDNRFIWKGREKLNARPGAHKQPAGYQLSAYVQLNPPASATSTDLRSDWRLLAVGTSYGFVLYDYAIKQTVVNRCTLNVQDFAIVSGDAGAGAISRKKSFRKSLRESFRRLRRGRSQRQQQTQQLASANTPADGGATTGVKPAFSRAGQTTGARTLGSSLAAGSSSVIDTAAQAAAAHRNLCSGERQVEFKNELSSIVKCITLTSAIITTNPSLFKPSLWVGTNSGSVLVYAIELATERQLGRGSESSEQPAASSSTEPSSSTSSAPKSSARLVKEVQLKHKAPIIAIFPSPEAPASLSAVPQSEDDSAKSTPTKSNASELFSAADRAERKSQTAESEANEQADGQQRVQTPQPDNKFSSPAADSSGKHKEAAAPHQQPRVLICSEEQFKVFNLPNMKPFCKFKLTAHEGLRAKKISITQFLKPACEPQQLARSASKALLPSSTSSKSLATQTSRPASPAEQQVMPSVDSLNDNELPDQQANGAQSKQKQQEESNNNSTSALDNNNSASGKVKQDKELLTAKFGVKTNALSSTPDKSSIEQQHQQEASTEPSLEPYMVCMSNQGDCAIYSVPDLKRQAQIQVCKREDVNGIMSAMLTNYGEGFYLRSSSNFLRFSISSQRVLRVTSVI